MLDYAIKEIWVICDNRLQLDAFNCQQDVSQGLYLSNVGTFLHCIGLALEIRTLTVHFSFSENVKVVCGGSIYQFNLLQYQVLYLCAWRKEKSMQQVLDETLWDTDICQP